MPPQPESTGPSGGRFTDRLIPVPAGFDDPVKARAGQVERAWEAVTGTLGFAGAGGAAAMAAGAAIPPVAPFVAAIAAGSFFLKLRAKWAKEDPPRPDYHLVAEYRPPRLDMMAILPPGPIPPGAAIVSLLHATGASVEATVLALERAMGASFAAWGPEGHAAASHEAARMSEAREHAKRSEMLATSLNAAAHEFGSTLDGWYHVAYEPGPDYMSLREMLDARLLGSMIAAGIDPRLFDARVSMNPERLDKEMSAGALLARAGEASQMFGMELGRWAVEEAMRLPHLPEGPAPMGM